MQVQEIDSMPTTADTTTTAVEDLVTSLYRLGVVQREIARHALAELGSQGFTALAVIHRYGPVRVSDVAERLRIDLSVASRQCAALASAGYAERQADPADRRAYRITATERGTRVLSESHRRMVEAFARPLAGWAEDEIVLLAQRLDRLRDDFAESREPMEETPQETTAA
jgi:DNA-binding MarR family transcriptional regulator